MVRLTDRPDMTLDVYGGRKTTTQQQQQQLVLTKPSDIDKCKSKNEASVSDTLTLFLTEVLKGKYG